MIFTLPALGVFLAVAAAIMLGTAGYFLIRAIVRARRARNRERQLFFVRLARSESAIGENEMQNFEAFFSTILKFRKPIALEAVVPHVGGAPRLYVSVPSSIADAFVQSVRNAGSSVAVSPASEHQIFNHGGSSAAATVRRVLTDSLAPMLRGLQGLETVGEGAAAQLIIRPARRFSPVQAEPVFHANIRLVASAPSEFRARDIVESLAQGFRASPARNPAAILSAFLSREFNERETLEVSARDLARALTFPAAASESSPVFPSSAFPMDAAIRPRHLCIVGQAGTGKSAFLGSLASQDINAGRGVCVIDPLGGLVANVMSRIPEERMRDVVVFDPSDLARPIGVNALEFDPAYPEEKERIAGGLMEIFGTLGDFEAVQSPEFERALKHALLLLMDNPAKGFTLAELPRLFSDSAFRSRLAASCRNEAVRRFWENEATLPEFAHLIPHLASRFAGIILNDYVRPVVASSRSAFDFRSVSDGGKIFLAHIPKEKIGRKTAAFLGMMLMHKLAHVSHARDFHLYVDEFNDFAVPSITALLSQADGRRLHLTAANRSAAPFNNAESIIAFRVTPEDAAVLEKRFAPAFTVHDLASIRNGSAHAHLSNGGVTGQPFTISIPLPVSSGVSHAALMRDTSRARYGRNRSEAEWEIYERARTG